MVRVRISLPQALRDEPHLYAYACTCTCAQEGRTCMHMHIHAHVHRKAAICMHMHAHAHVHTPATWTPRGARKAAISSTWRLRVMTYVG